MIEMEVAGVAPEPNSNRPLVWLKDKEQRLFLPIAIGNFEAIAIHMELYDEPPPRPIVYDLMRSILDGFHFKVEQIVINALKDDTYFAEVTLTQGDQTMEMDSRPSDAIALALRAGAPIFVEEEVIQEAGLEVDGPEGLEGIDLVRAPELETLLLDSDVTDQGRPEKPPDGATDWMGQRVVTLKARLQEAVEKEEYEEAARLRDEIGRIEHQEK